MERRYQRAPGRARCGLGKYQKEEKSRLENSFMSLTVREEQNFMVSVKMRLLLKFLKRELEIMVN